MQKLIAILTVFCLALAISVQAAKPEEDAAKKPAPKSKTVQKQQVAPKQHQMKAPNTHVKKVHTEHVNKPVTNTANTTVPKKPSARMLPPSVNAPANVQSNKVHKNKPQFETNTQQQQQVQANTQLPAVQKNKLSKQSVAKIRAQHRNFHAQRNTSISSVQFNKNYQISAAQNWSGSNYQVFRSYRPQWHDQGWWRTHHHRISLIGGGWYFWDAGYWYPAWGYDEAASYYPYDGPIYSGPSARPFDQVVADVQAALQEQGYYKGEVDGLLGPLTREALAEYQQANGLYATQTIDEPTLNSLGLG